MAGNTSEDESTSLPWPAFADGAYRVIVVTNADHRVYEGTNGTNNQLVGNTDLVFGHPDLTATITAPLSPPPTAGDTLSFTWHVANAGTGPALGSWTDRVYLSATSSVDASAILLGHLDHSGPLAPRGRSVSGHGSPPVIAIT